MYIKFLLQTRGVVYILPGLPRFRPACIRVDSPYQVSRGGWGYYENAVNANQISSIIYGSNRLSCFQGDYSNDIPIGKCDANISWKKRISVVIHLPKRLVSDIHGTI